MKTIYLAAGCFWATEKLFADTPGVISVVSGYANGKKEIENPSYELVCGGMTNYKETVRVEYDESEVSLKKLLLIYFNVIDPTVMSRQGADVGTQYQTGIFYTEDDQLKTIDEIADPVREKARQFCVLIEPFDVFYDAEEYHQKYLEKNPNGYCHISRSRLSTLPTLGEEELEQMLSEKQYF